MPISFQKIVNLFASHRNAVSFCGRRPYSIVCRRAAQVGCVCVYIIQTFSPTNKLYMRPLLKVYCCACQVIFPTNWCIEWKGLRWSQEVYNTFHPQMVSKYPHNNILLPTSFQLSTDDQRSCMPSGRRTKAHAECCYSYKLYWIGTQDVPFYHTL